MHRSWDTLHAIKSMSIDKRNYLLITCQNRRLGGYPKSMRHIWWWVGPFAGQIQKVFSYFLTEKGGS